MKKIVILGCLIISMLALFALAQEETKAPSWLQKTVWGDDIVWSVGTAVMVKKSDEAYINALMEATTQSIQLLRTHLKVAEVKDFQVIETWHDGQQLWVLGACLRASNPSGQALALPPAPPPPPLPTYAADPVTRPEQTISEAQAIEAADAINIEHYENHKAVPKDWWTLYHPLPNVEPKQKDYIANVFRVGDTLYAIGFAFPNPKFQGEAYWASGETAARGYALRNMAGAINGIYCQAKNKKGDYILKIEANIRTNLFSDASMRENPHRIMDPASVFVLISVPLANVNAAVNQFK
ncbi:MAG: hypothetical protein WC460_03340 [Patescibacteria group bacterium]